MGQKFYTVGNSMECPACGKPIDGGISALVDHLKDDHDMTDDQAMIVLGGSNENSAPCAECDHSTAAHDIMGDGACKTCDCKKYKPGIKGRYDNSVYVPPLVSLKQKVAAGERQYGAKNSAGSGDFVCVICDKDFPTLVALEAHVESMTDKAHKID